MVLTCSDMTGLSPTRVVALAFTLGAGAGACEREPLAAEAQAPPPRQTKGADLTPKTEAPPVAEVLSNAFASAAEAVRPSVVRLDVESRGPDAQAGRGAPPGRGVPPGFEDFMERFFGPQGPGAAPPGPQRGTGSGVIIDDRGHVVTNSHVVEGAKRVTIQLADGRKFPGVVVGHDPYTDVGVVRFEKRPPDLTVARLGDSNALRVGQWVIAVGSPLGLSQTVTAGIVSGLGRTGGRMRLSGERVSRYIQTDALINPGNSGGPLVTLQGEVVGINSIINVGPGGSYGFAIPIAQVARVAQTLIKDGRMRYPYLGVLVGDLADIPAEERRQLGAKLPDEGVVVTQVTPGGPAAQAGVQAGDVITKIAGEPAAKAQDVIEKVSSRPIGSKVALEVRRGGQTRTIDVRLGELPTPGAAAETGGPSIGAALQTLSEPIARSLGVDPALKGAVVAEVKPGSPAARAGLQPGDVIREVDRKPVSTAQEAAAAIRAGGKKTRLLRVTSAAGTRYVTVTPE